MGLQGAIMEAKISYGTVRYGTVRYGTDAARNVREMPDVQETGEDNYRGITYAGLFLCDNLID